MPAQRTEIFALQIWRRRGQDGANPKVQSVRQCKPGGAAALGSPYGGAGERSASLRGRRQWQIWEKCGDCSRVPPQSRLTPCQLSQRESQGAGFARPAHRNFCIANLTAQSARRCKPGGAECKTEQTRRRSPPLAPPYGGAGERSASLRGRRQWQIWEKYGRLLHGTLSVTANAVPALPKGEPRGGPCPPGASKSPDANPAAQPPLAPPMRELASDQRA